MSDDRMGGIALVAGAVAGIITMSIHPTGNDLLAPGHFSSVAVLGVVAHTLAIASMPISFLGALALSRRLASPSRLAVVAIVVYGFALAAGVVAATLSGFVAPGVAREMLDATPPSNEGWRLLFNYTGRLNQGFALVLAVASSAAIMLWSIAMLRTRDFARGIAIYGIILGPAIIIAVLSGYLTLHVAGFGAIIGLQAIWFVVVGAGMYGPLRGKTSILVGVLLVLLLAALGMHLIHSSMHAPKLGADNIELRSPQVSLPMNPFQGRPTVKVTIDGNGPYRFLFDTGAAASIIDPQLADTLHMHYLGEIHITGGNHHGGVPAKIFQTRHVVAGDLNLSGLRLIAVALPQFPGNDADPPRGVLSPLMLLGYTVTFDYPRKTILIGNGELPPANGQEIFQYDAPYLPRVPMQIGNKTINFDVDSGSGRGLMLPQQYANELQLTSPPIAAAPYRTVDGSSDAYSATLNGTAVMGHYRFDQPAITLVQDLPVANIGSLLLNQFVITLDPKNHRIQFVRP